MSGIPFRFPSVAKAVLPSLFLVWAATVSATDVSSTLAPQSATASGSNGSVIMVGTGGISSDGTASGVVEYVNKDNDQAILGNYLKGYYYDTELGFFKLDWSADTSKNVRFVASTTRCATGYGYSLGGYAYGQDGGLIDFGYSPSASVYYCESDQKLHGHAYSVDAGFQNFEGISLVAWNGSYHELFVGAGTGQNSNFVNDSTMLVTGIPEELRPTLIQGETMTRSWGAESVFYIVK